MSHLYLRHPAAAIAPLEAAIRIDPSSRMALGLLGYAYAVSGDTTAAGMRARVEGMPTAPGSDVAIARIAIGFRDTSEALNRLERAARARSVLRHRVGDFADLRPGSQQRAVCFAAAIGGRLAARRRSNALIRQSTRVPAR